MELVLDVENTVTHRGGKMHLDPFEATNKLVQVGVQEVVSGNQSIYNFDHTEANDYDGSQAKALQDYLDRTTLLILHNGQHDMPWLWESGFKYDGLIYDTMLAEYVLMRGNHIEMTYTGAFKKKSLALGECAIRRKLDFQKDDTLKKYFKDGYNTNEIPLKELTYYLQCDLSTTRALYLDIEADYAQPESESLRNIRDITFKVCLALSRMYSSGIKVDLKALDEVRKQFEEEKADIEGRLGIKVRNLMGDTPINLNSPAQMSEVVYSMRPNNKKEWVDLFDHTKTDKEYKSAVKANTTMVRKTTAFTCPECKGEGSVYRIKKDGTKFARPNKCKPCEARGYQLKKTNQLAGLGFMPPSKKWVSANGFSTGKDNLDTLMSTARANGMDSAVDFLGDLKRLSAISSYLSSFVEGISVFTKEDGFLHVGLTQHITSTGRFSGRNPNMQNMPRGGTFPVKKVFVSRWEGGYVMEADFAQLEFRVAAFLSQDTTAMKEIDTGFDVHSYTAKVISEAGQPTSRQDAKAHTFAPLFGATGYGRSPAEAAYYTHFIKKYKGIAAWHKKLGDEAIRFQKITNVGGRQYAFPNTERRPNGMPTNFTMIKNYPVQGFATGDCVPVVLLELEDRLMPMRSKVVNSVHDSMVIDIHPYEKDQVIEIINTLNMDLNEIIYKYYKVKMNVPLLLEAKIGPNWLDTKDV
jgi:DNA polymerase I-like protein with 3'-5' exonuclease and polymerase domains